MGLIYKILTRIKGNLRQRRFPREFRIAPADWPADVEALRDQLAAMLHALSFGLQTNSTDPLSALSTPPPTTEQFRFLGELGTHIWRLRQRLIDPESKQPIDETRRIYRHLESAWDTLSQAGIEIRDHTGEPFPENGVSSLKTLAFQPTPGVLRETVLETIRPTVYFGSEIIQIGEVVVGVPEKATSIEMVASASQATESPKVDELSQSESGVELGSCDNSNDRTIPEQADNESRQQTHAPDITANNAMETSIRQVDPKSQRISD